MKIVKLFILVLFLVSCAGVDVSSRGPASDKGNWGVLILSDIHIYTKKSHNSFIPNKFQNLLKQLEAFTKENNIKLIILSGDSTSGNPGDNISYDKMKTYWDELSDAFAPLKEQGLMVLPVAGNHDYYTQNHKAAFKYGVCQLSNLKELCAEKYESDWSVESNGLRISSNSNLYYRIDQNKFSILALHIPSYVFDNQQIKWIQAQTDIEAGVAIGHTALTPRVQSKADSKTSKNYQKMFQDININHYFCGHEHYFWDDLLGQDSFRQTIVGTASGTYNYGPNLVHVNKQCDRGSSKYHCLTTEEQKFSLRLSNRLPVDAQQFVMIKVANDSSYKVTALTVDKDAIIEAH